MADPITLRAFFHPTMQIPFKIEADDHPFTLSGDRISADLMDEAEDLFEKLAAEAGCPLELQINVIWNVKDFKKSLNPDDTISQNFATGDTFGIYGDILQKLPKETKELRFGLNDRIVCNLGIRWVGGHVVGTDPEQMDEWCYLVKTDPHPGIESRTITVPVDSDHVCVQEVCFSLKEMRFVKGAAPEFSGNEYLRFAVGDRVSCRVRHNGDYLENWQRGKVQSVKVDLPVPLEWGDSKLDDELKGMYPSSVAYLVNLDCGGCVLCHADNYTLIRCEGLESQDRVKGVSKRMEDRREANGDLVRFDHMTERKKVLESGASEENRISSVNELTDEQKKALFIE